MKQALISFFASSLALAFAYGLAVGTYEIFPYQYIKSTLNAVETVIANRDTLLDPDRPNQFLAERRYAGSGVTHWDKTSAAPGLTLLSGFFNDLPGLRLIDMQGSVIREWPVAFHELFTRTGHILPADRVPATNWNAAVHGMHLFPDGSVVFNMDGMGLAKLDRCGQPLWVLPRMTHHSIDLTEDGKLWVPSMNYYTEAAKHDLFQLPYREDTLLQVSAQGEVLQDVSLIDIFLQNDLYALLVSNGAFNINVRAEDVFHLNDIEALPGHMAASFPAFEAGDLLMSLRHLNMLLVVDPDDWRVKWYQIGPWLRQHDPDFHANGSISVYNNKSDDSKNGDRFGGSEILSFIPGEFPQKVSVVYGPENDDLFFTNTQGKHQTLENGNVLVSEYYGGRAFEFDRSAKIVWQYVNAYDDKEVAKISGAMRYPESYFTVDDWSCPGD